MKCSECSNEDPKCINGVCNSCRLKKWRRDNPEKVKAYAKMRQVRDVDKIKARQKISSNDYMFGGNRTNVLERDNYTCQTCGTTNKNNTRIVVHHKDRTGWGKKKKDKNNSMDNLISLCVPCHLAVHYNHRYPQRASRPVHKASLEESP